MKILVIASESQVYRDNTFKKKKRKLLSKDEIMSIKLNERINIAPEKYAGPAFKIYQGRLKEVFNFYCRIKQKKIDIDLIILSSFYSIVKPDNNIVPYWTDNGELLLDELPDQLKIHIQSADKVILLLSSKLIKKFAEELNRHLFNKKIAVVSGSSVAQYINNADIFLAVPGVTPIGKENEEKLVNWINSL